MGKRPKRWTGVLLNAALVVGGILVVVLFYALVSRYVAPTGPPESQAGPVAPAGDIIQVEVRNGIGVSGLAGEVTHYLRRQGFDVVEVGNLGSFDGPNSVVVDRVGNLEAAKRVAAALGIPEERVTQEIQPDLYLDASVIIGQDYRDLKPFGKE
jgi:hypothetical protein